MNIIEPWKTQIGQFNLADKFNMSDFATEIFTLYSMTGGEDETQSKIDPDVFPIIMEMRDDVITPALREFTKNCFNYVLDDFDVETNGKWIPPGEGLFPHYHAGSCFSVIVYPEDSPSALNMFDPRSHACRGYPKAIRDHHMAKYQISPKAGDVYIFPSYIQHSVSHVQEDIRLSLLHEYYPRHTR